MTYYGQQQPPVGVPPPQGPKRNLLVLSSVNHCLMIRVCSSPLHAGYPGPGKDAHPPPGYPPPPPAAAEQRAFIHGGVVRPPPLARFFLLSSTCTPFGRVRRRRTWVLVVWLSTVVATQLASCWLDGDGLLTPDRRSASRKALSTRGPPRFTAACFVCSVLPESEWTRLVSDASVYNSYLASNPFLRKLPAHVVVDFFTAFRCICLFWRWRNDSG
jgi:hypothetical protein